MVAVREARISLTEIKSGPPRRRRHPLDVMAALREPGIGVIAEVKTRQFHRRVR